MLSGSESNIFLNFPKELMLLVLFHAHEISSGSLILLAHYNKYQKSQFGNREIDLAEYLKGQIWPKKYLALAMKNRRPDLAALLVHGVEEDDRLNASYAELEYQSPLIYALKKSDQKLIEFLLQRSQHVDVVSFVQNRSLTVVMGVKGLGGELSLFLAQTDSKIFAQVFEYIEQHHLRIPQFPEHLWLRILLKFSAEFGSSEIFNYLDKKQIVSKFQYAEKLAALKGGDLKIIARVFETRENNQNNQELFDLLKCVIRFHRTEMFHQIWNLPNFEIAHHKNKNFEAIYTNNFFDLIDATLESKDQNILSIIWNAHPEIKNSPESIKPNFTRLLCKFAEAGYELFFEEILVMGETSGWISNDQKILSDDFFRLLVSVARGGNDKVLAAFLKFFSFEHYFKQYPDHFILLLQAAAEFGKITFLEKIVAHSKICGIDTEMLKVFFESLSLAAIRSGSIENLKCIFEICEESFDPIHPINVERMTLSDALSAAIHQDRHEMTKWLWGKGVRFLKTNSNENIAEDDFVSLISFYDLGFIEKFFDDFFSRYPNAIIDKSSISNAVIKTLQKFRHAPQFYLDLINFLSRNDFLDLNVSNANFQNLLLNVVDAGYFLILELLLKQSASLNPLVFSEKEALMAQLLEKSLKQYHYAMARLLLRYGANPNVPTEKGNCLLQAAFEISDVVAIELLLKYGAYFLREEQLELKSVANIFFYAIKNNGRFTLRFFLERYSSQELALLQDEKGRNPVEVAEVFHREEISRMLGKHFESSQDKSVQAFTEIHQARIKTIKGLINSEKEEGFIRRCHPGWNGR